MFLEILLKTCGCDYMVQNTIFSVSSLSWWYEWPKFSSISVECIQLDPLPRAPVSAMRRHDYKLSKRQCRSHARLTFFSFLVVTLWNNLPSEVVSAHHMNTFKGRLDK